MSLQNSNNNNEKDDEEGGLGRSELRDLPDDTEEHLPEARGVLD